MPTFNAQDTIHVHDNTFTETEHNYNYYDYHQETENLNESAETIINVNVIEPIPDWESGDAGGDLYSSVNQDTEDEASNSVGPDALGLNVGPNKGLKDEKGDGNGDDNEDGGEDDEGYEEAEEGYNDYEEDGELC